MKINGTSGANAVAGAMSMDAGTGGQTDPMVRDLQRQIEDLQNRMKELSSNPELTAEMKAKKRQELQKQISDLEMQLRQRQMEVKREEIAKRQENYSMDEMLGTKQQTKKSGKQNTGLSSGSMEAMISADTSMKQADVSGSVTRKMEDRAGVLETEIKLDRSRGFVAEWKDEALAETQTKANEAASAQMSALAQADKAAEKAVEESKEQDEEEKDKVESGKDDNTFDTEQLGVPFSRGYNPVDVKV